jgi:hypothetical protein
VGGTVVLQIRRQLEALRSRGYVRFQRPPIVESVETLVLESSERLHGENLPGDVMFSERATDVRLALSEEG